MSLPEETSRYLLRSKKYGHPLFAAAWVPNRTTRRDEPEASLVVLAGGGGNQRSGVPNSLLLALFASTTAMLTDALHALPTGDAPYRLAVHPAGAELVRSVGSECRLFEVDGDGSEGVKLVAAERSVQGLKGVGEQNSLVLGHL